MIRRGFIGGLILASIGGGSATAGFLNTIIKENQKNLNSRVQKLDKQVDRELIKTPSTATRVVDLPEPRLWIHKRSTEQDSLVDWVEKQAALTELPGGPVEIKPVQLLNSGPRTSQLRYFKSVDRDRVETYSTVTWLKAGHFELWLAPDQR
jgi:hypothetical protein